MELSNIVMSGCTFLVGLGIGYYKSLNDLSKLYCLKSDCAAIRGDCTKHKDVQDKQIEEIRMTNGRIQVDIAEIKTTLKAMAAK